MNDSEYVDAKALESITGTRASTWRYWAFIGSGPPSFKIGRRRVWRRSAVEAWLAAQESGPGAAVHVDGANREAGGAK